MLKKHKINKGNKNRINKMRKIMMRRKSQHRRCMPKNVKKKNNNNHNLNLNLNHNLNHNHNHNLNLNNNKLNSKVRRVPQNTNYLSLSQLFQLNKPAKSLIQRWSSSVQFEGYRNWSMIPLEQKKAKYFNHSETTLKEYTNNIS